MNDPMKTFLRFHRFLPLLVTLHFLLVSGVAAQPKEEAPPIDIHFRCLGWKITPEPPFEFYAEGKWTVIDDLSTFHRSLKPYHYIGPNPVVFYRQNPEGVREPVCEVDLSASYLEPLLLFTQVNRPGQESPRYHALLFEDHDSRFPPGSFQFVNMTKLPLQGKVGETPFQLAPGKQLNVIPTLPASQRAVHFLLATQEASGNLRPLQSSYIQYDSDTKHLTFVLPHPNGRGNVNTFTITEIKKPVADESAPKTEE